MTLEDFSQKEKETTRSRPLLVSQYAGFQWTAELGGADLDAGWQHHLTRYLVASATVSVSFKGQERLHLLEGAVLDDPLNVYQLTLREQAVEVRASYRALGEAFADAPYDCHLELKTEMGACQVTLPAPKPPGQAEWKQVLKKLWFQLLLVDDARLAVSDPLAKEQPLYTFTLQAELEWQDVVSPPTEGASGEWQRELRLVRDLAHPGKLRAVVGWDDEHSLSHPALEVVRVGTAIFPPSVPVEPVPGPERAWGVVRTRMAAVTGAVLLLGLIGILALSATRGTASSNDHLTFSNLSPTASQAPSNGSPTTPPTNAPTASPAPGATAQPTPPIPTQPPPHATPTPSPTPPPTPTDTPPPPTPTDTPPPPTPTDTPPPPTPTDTPPPPTPTDTPPPPTPTDTPPPPTPTP